MSKLFARMHSWLRSVMGRQRLESEMDAEICFHIEARAADLVRDGMGLKEAMRQARVEFGGTAKHKDEMRHSLGLRWWDELWGDLRYAGRILRKSPGFTLIAVSSLALAIGANTTIFSVANEMLFERLGVPHAEQLRLLTAIADEHSVAQNVWAPTQPIAGGGMRFKAFTYPVYQQLRKQNKVLEDVFGFKDLGRVNVTLDGSAQPEYLQLVSGNFYQQMRVMPQLGRPILPADDGAPGTGAVAVISDGYWSRAFGRSREVLGKTIDVNTFPVTIVGVNPKGFTGAESVQTSPDLFMPLSVITLLKPSSIPGGTLLSNTQLWWIEVMGRAKAGVPETLAQASLDTVLSAGVRGATAVSKDETVPHLRLEDGSRGLNATGERFAQPLHVLLVMVAFVLLLACANVANLMLARASTREREMSVRLALGAGRWRILRQVMTESLLVSALGGGLGLLLGYLGRTVIPKLLANAWERNDLQVPFDWKVFAFTASITIATGVLFGIAPAWSATRAEIGTALKKGNQSVTRRRRRWSGKGLVVFQICMSTLLVAGAILFLRTLINLSSINPGFHVDHLLLFAIDPPSQRYTPPQAVALHGRIEEAIRHVPGVEDATLSDVPLLANWMSNSSFYVEGAVSPSPQRDAASRTADIADVGADYFQVMGIPIIAGRAFTQQDADAGRHVSVINEAAAKKFFPGRNPIGMHFGRSGPKIPPEDLVEVIGVCRDTLYSSLREEAPPVHFDLYRQFPEIGSATYIVRTQLKPKAIVPSLRAVVQGIDHDLPLIDVRTQQQQIDDDLQQERMFATLSAGFGVLALMLACVGIYGIMAYTVVQRTNEIGIRLALGAERGQVRGMVLREAGGLAVVGVVGGLAVALFLGRLVKSMLYGLQPADPLSLVGAGCLLLGVALVAGWVPAMRASRVQPMEALRHE